MISVGGHALKAEDQQFAQGSDIFIFRGKNTDCFSLAGKQTHHRNTM